MNLIEKINIQLNKDIRRCLKYGFTPLDKYIFNGYTAYENIHYEEIRNIIKLKWEARKLSRELNKKTDCKLKFSKTKL